MFEVQRLLNPVIGVTSKQLEIFVSLLRIAGQE
jgi:hypothetical protein